MVFFAQLLALALAAAKPPAGATPRPSVVLITLDTTRADRIGCYGRAGAGTPSLDRLASSGARFAECWSPAPITLPAHLAMMTGCTPATHGVRDNGVSRYDGRIPTLAARFAAAGWRTAAVVSAPVLDSVWGIDAGFGTYDAHLDGPRERSGAGTTARALEMARAGSSPFFLWVHYFEPHWPYEPPEPFRTRYREDPYQGEIAAMDAEIGKLLDGLSRPEQPLIVVVAGDHGESLGEHGERTHGIFTYRSTLRVPFVIAGPGVPRGRVVPGLVSLVDLAPTVAALAGLPGAEREDGRSLVSAVGGESLPPRTIGYESMLPNDSYGWAAPRGLTDGRYAFIDLPKRELYDLTADPGQTKNIYTDGDPVGRRFLEALGPPPAAASEAPISEEERAKLASLGYVGRASAPAAAPILDPKDVVDLAEAVDRAKELYASGRHRETIAAADAILRRNPRNVPALSVRAQALLADRRYRDAIGSFQAALALAPTSAVNRFDLGSAFAGAGDVTSAEAEWRKAIALDPHFAAPRASLIASSHARGDLSGALAAATDAQAAGAESAELSVETGVVLATAGRLDDARRAFETALRLRPDDAQALGDLAQLAYQEGKFDEAIARYRAAAAAAPADPSFLKSIGAILWNDRHDLAGARRAFRQALEIERDPAERARLADAIDELSKEE
ncbi:MAG TPA: sulfatase-like hydrolase/transferase [Candidatus Polarisedimenticolaceae bacterium]|nr:sulfatase-like hydrolase/transferase [Candidatus Polarisedimenticolaceae bacterium]